jgi:hypothetical protein
MVIRRCFLINASALVLCLRFCCPAFGADQALNWCGDGQGFLADKAGRAVWLDFAELKKHAIDTPDAKTPPSFRTTATVSVDVLIGGDGRVKCANAPAGHPLLRLEAAKAAKSWTFEPFVADGRPVKVLGHVEFRFGH